MILGLLFCVLAGLCWVAVGVAVGTVERHGWPVRVFQVVNGALSSAICAAALLFGRRFAPGSESLRFTGAWIPAACLLVCGTLNYSMTVAMAAGMRRGPNGLVWTITQSGPVFPFLMGVFVLGNTSLTWPRGLGILLILANLVASRLGKKEADSKPGASLTQWFPAAVVAFLFCGATQCTANLPSYLASAEVSGTGAIPETSALERTLWCMLGGLVAWFAHGAVLLLLPPRGKAENAPPPDRPARSLRYLLLPVAVVTITGVLSAAVFQFNGLDLLARANAGAVGYPLMVSSCLIGFFLYSALILRERQTPAQYAGLAACVAGSVLLCV